MPTQPRSGSVELNTRTASAAAAVAAPATGWRATSTRPGEVAGTACTVGTMAKASRATSGAILGSVPMPVKIPPRAIPVTQ